MKKVTCLQKVNEAPTSQFNDGKCDPIGRVWSDDNDMSSMEHIGHLYSMDVDGSLTDRLDKIGVSNGLGWTEDNKTMFFIDSVPRNVYAFDYDVNDGSISMSIVSSGQVLISEQKLEKNIGTKIKPKRRNHAVQIIVVKTNSKNA
ncbi:hypothetical protein FSP39_007550 [Pinctada imbricata]|uniref:SMP-30/Gluconolactonase/LRE-like region domain-containing protein n=1 Tax=Pinctada imbricata TaxID=66713 RepID=A0AA88XU41_PINIB|nr:hypothetical protein FSP39_007550 [Pinctada imbricata]